MRGRPSSMGAADVRDMLREPVDALRPAGFHALEHAPGIVDARDREALHGEFRPAAVLDKGDGRESLEQDPAFPIDRDVVEDEPRGRIDHAEYAGHWMLAAVGRAHDDAQRAADPRIDLTDWVREALRTPPAREV